MQRGYWGLQVTPIEINDIHSGLGLIHINYSKLNVDDECKLLLRNHPRRIENACWFVI